MALLHIDLEMSGGDSKWVIGIGGTACCWWNEIPRAVVSPLFEQRLMEHCTEKDFIYSPITLCITEAADGDTDLLSFFLFNSAWALCPQRLNRAVIPLPPSREGLWRWCHIYHIPKWRYLSLQWAQSTERSRARDPCRRHCFMISRTHHERVPYRCDWSCLCSCSSAHMSPQGLHVDS